MDGKAKTEGVERLWDKYKFVALVVLIVKNIAEYCGRKRDGR